MPLPLRLWEPQHFSSPYVSKASSKICAWDLEVLAFGFWGLVPWDLLSSFSSHFYVQKFLWPRVIVIGNWEGVGDLGTPGFGFWWLDWTHIFSMTVNIYLLIWIQSDICVHSLYIFWTVPAQCFCQSSWNFPKERRTYVAVVLPPSSGSPVVSICWWLVTQTEEFASSLKSEIWGTVVASFIKASLSKIELHGVYLESL